ncbi:MAG: hypothetical protein NWE93_06765 [Candidatus Bathyarchaeota archaeon]|nr:hypothetical protein [Candidatus Bathyarchaeota archaeon]
MAELKLVLITSILCILLGVGVIVGAAIAYPLLSSPIDNLEATVSSTLTKADSALQRAQTALTSTRATLVSLTRVTNLSLPSLNRSGQLTGAIADNLTSIGSTVTSVGQTLGGISVAGTSPFGAVGSTVSSIGEPITTAANQLQSVSLSITSIGQQTAEVPNTLNTAATQLGSVNSALGDLRVNIEETQNSLPSYFSLIRLVLVLAILGAMGLGAIFLLIGISLFMLRRKTNQQTLTLYRYYSKYPL